MKRRGFLGFVVGAVVAPAVKADQREVAYFINNEMGRKARSISVARAAERGFVCDYFWFDLDEAGEMVNIKPA